MNTTDTSARLRHSREQIRQALDPARPSPLPDWWASPHWAMAFKLADHATKAVLQPVTQHHPYALVLAAAAIGAATVLARPGRWLSAPLLLASVLPSVLAQAIHSFPAQGHDVAPKKV